MGGDGGGCQKTGRGLWRFQDPGYVDGLTRRKDETGGGRTEYLKESQTHGRTIQGEDGEPCYTEYKQWMVS